MEYLCPFVFVVLIWYSIQQRSRRRAYLMDKYQDAGIVDQIMHKRIRQGASEEMVQDTSSILCAFIHEYLTRYISGGNALNAQRAGVERLVTVFRSGATMSKKRKKKQPRRIAGKKPSKKDSKVGFPSMQRMYADAKSRAFVEYPSLLGIHECPKHLYRLPDSEFLTRYGYSMSARRYWKSDSDDYEEHSKSLGNIAGHVSVFTEGEHVRPAIFIMWPTTVRSREHAHALLVALLFHELGHVDDFTRGVYLILDTEVSVSAAEEYAHHFACERIMQQVDYCDSYRRAYAPDLQSDLHAEWRDTLARFFRVIMGFYLRDLLGGYAELPHESVRGAAQRVLDSPQFKEYRRFAGDEF